MGGVGAGPQGQGGGEGMGGQVACSHLPTAALSRCRLRFTATISYMPAAADPLHAILLPLDITLLLRPLTAITMCRINNNAIKYELICMSFFKFAL